MKYELLYTNLEDCLENRDIQDVLIDQFMKIQELRPETRKLQFITDSQNN
jgi:hypothetical protein